MVVCCRAYDWALLSVSTVYDGAGERQVGGTLVVCYRELSTYNLTVLRKIDTWVVWWQNIVRGSDYWARHDGCVMCVVFM